MERMGLWGDGAPFRSFEQFIDTVQKKGLGENLASHSLYWIGTVHYRKGRIYQY